MSHWEPTLQVTLGQPRYRRPRCCVLVYLIYPLLSSKTQHCFTSHAWYSYMIKRAWHDVPTISRLLFPRPALYYGPTVCLLLARSRRFGSERMGLITDRGRQESNYMAFEESWYHSFDIYEWCSGSWFNNQRAYSAVKRLCKKAPRQDEKVERYRRRWIYETYKERRCMRKAGVWGRQVYGEVTWAGRNKHFWRIPFCYFSTFYLLSCRHKIHSLFHPPMLCNGISSREKFLRRREERKEDNWAYPPTALSRFILFLRTVRSACVQRLCTT